MVRLVWSSSLLGVEALGEFGVGEFGVEDVLIGDDWGVSSWARIKGHFSGVELPSD